MFTVAELLSYCVTGAARKQLYRDLPTIVQLDFHLHRGKLTAPNPAHGVRWELHRKTSWCRAGDHRGASVPRALPSGGVLLRQVGPNIPGECAGD